VKAALTLVALVAAGQAQALSCMRPDPATSFAAASTSDLPYLVLTGDLTSPAATGKSGPKPISVLGHLNGHGLTAAGFTATFDGDVVLQVTCAGPWCGAVPASGPVVAFARIDGPTPVIEADACGMWLFAAPDTAMIDQLTACMTGADCSAQSLQ